MGVFFIDTSKEETVEAKQKYQKEINELSKEMLEKAADIDNDQYPDFLWEVQLNEFAGDDYRLKGTCSNPNVVKAYTIRRKYASYWDYLDALSAYYDYVDYVDSAYGSFEMMKKSFDMGFSPIFIPKKPKLTSKKKNKELIRSGFIPSRLDEDYEVSGEILDAVIASIPECVLSFDEVKKTKLDKRLEEASARHRRKTDRLNSIYAGGVYSLSPMARDESNAIVAYLNSEHDGKSLDERISKKSSFAEEMESLHEYDHIPEDILEDMFEPASMSIQNGFAIDNKKKRQLQILEALEAAGWDFLGSSITKGIDKSSIRAITSKYGRGEIDYSELTPKQLKKLKKKEAKRRRKVANAMMGDSKLEQALLHNRINISRDKFLQDQEDFLFSDVFNT